MKDRLVIKGARQHNLRDVSVEYPRDALIVLAGVSGSGESSLTFDTIFAEGQRRHVESLSVHSRQFLGLLDKPDAEVIEGISLVPRHLRTLHDVGFGSVAACPESCTGQFPRRVLGGGA